MIPRRGFAVVVIVLSLSAAAGCGPDLLKPAFAPGVPTPTSRAGSSTHAIGANGTLAITIAGGTVSPTGANIRVRLGQRIQVTAVSDVAESIHIHGYDITLMLPPAVPGKITFTANQIGVFNIETHESGKLVATLIVS
jgi:FtsP/CotA-like multicopper oxidase with cupredoxin domain